MDLNSIAIVCFLVAGVAAIIFIIRHQKLAARAVRYPRIAEESRSSEMVISEVITYKETKAQMARFKAELDRLGDALETMALAMLGDAAQTSEAFRLGLPKTRQTLVATRNAAELLLALVEKRPPENEVAESVFGDDGLASKSFSFKSESSRRQSEQIVDHIKRRVGDVRPCIAGFYFALTIPDEQLRVSEAAEQIRLVVKHIDDAILKTTALEKMLD